MEVIEGEKAEFTLEANAHPRVVKWYKNGREIKDAAGVLEIKDNYTKFSLIIAKTNKGDAADYKVWVGQIPELSYYGNGFLRILPIFSVSVFSSVVHSS